MANLEETNPYDPPLSIEYPPDQVRAETPIVRRKFAILLLAVTVFCGITYTFIDEVILKTSFGAWPLLCIACAWSLAISILTRDALIAPIACFTSVMSGDLLAAVAKGWDYAQLHIALPLSLGFSIPSLVVALVLATSMSRSRSNRRALLAPTTYTSEAEKKDYYK